MLTRSYTISGSWNENTNTRDVMLNPTKLDGEASHRIMQIQQGIRVRLLQLEFLNGYDGDRGAGLYTKRKCRYFILPFCRQQTG